ncbi:hypothetical protein BO71DRAFT_477292 [Aspergillus ellipticus CBS 707.79]|uniref:DUF7025 domain-containing protein n=1 Tax=Aspergillus ellipticus CBS 707.79 TaxID=1448320 RepID=A0A319DA23_9EURO|nr:hypothetical protein BO71DRAFT_477292 [Aspergillus ellipticus CBS 707.79]
MTAIASPGQVWNSAICRPPSRSDEGLEQWQVLVDFLDTDLKPKMEWLRSEKCQKVSFSDIWYLFRPGDEVIDQGGKQAYRVVGVTSSSHRFISPYRTFGRGSKAVEKTPVILFCVHIDFDGKTLGPVLRRFAIPRFDGEKAVTSLRVYPLMFAQGRAQGTFREKLVARGRQFIDVLSSQKHMHYSGMTLESRDQVDGQVVIDFEKALEMNDRDQIQADRGERKESEEEGDGDGARGESREPEEEGDGDSDEADDEAIHPPLQKPDEQHQVASPQTGVATPAQPYLGGLPGGYSAAVPQAQPGYGMFNPMTGSPQPPQPQAMLNAQQNAQMWQNINPALYQQLLLQQGQMPSGTGFPGAMPGVMPGAMPGQPSFMGEGANRKQ